MLDFSSTGIRDVQSLNMCACQDLESVANKHNLSIVPDKATPKPENFDIELLQFLKIK